VEVETLEQLEEIISDPDEMRMQALLVRERILGPAHPDTSYYIRYRGAVYADMGHFERCITLWMYALDMQQQMLEPLSPMTQSSLLSFAELFSFMMSEGRTRNPNNDIINNNNQNNGSHQHQQNNSRPPPPVNFEDIMTVFEKAVREVRNGQEALRRAAAGAAVTAERDLTYFNRTLIIILHLVCLLTKLLPHLSATEVHRVKSAVFRFLRLDPRGRNGSTPLHLACTKDSSSVGRYPICQFPSLEAVRLLIECGADPNATDNDVNSALHVSAAAKPAKAPVVHTLLDAGAHLDASNGDGRTFADLLKGQHVYEVVNTTRYSSLQCLAAKVIRKQNISYKGLVAPNLEDFVDMH
jgi:hypothetical protein